jgi:hypothetical protein
VRRDGKAWRVELALSKGTIPIQAEARAAIPSTKLQAGRRLTVTGIVRRPRSNASDRRFAVIPRDASDIVVAGATTKGGGSAAAHSPDSGTTAARATPAVGGAASGAGNTSPRDVDLAGLAKYEGSLVRVGGILVARTGFRLTLHDATGTGVVRLPTSAAVLLSELALGEPLNAIGRVARVGRTTWEVVAAAPGDLARVGRLGPDLAASPDARSFVPDGSPARPAGPGSALDRAFGTGPIGTAALLPPALLFLGLGSAGLWAVGLYLRRRRPDRAPKRG